ncbi:MAG: hypothetical protein KBT58_01775 [Bizionia sp.]|nr:hypothetical protein [Bizionia sp.]
MRKLLLLTALLLGIIVQAQEYYSAEIILRNGNTKTGYSTLPSNKAFQKSIKFKTASKGSSKKIKSDAIDKIIFTLDDGKKYLFERSGMMYVTKKYHKNKEKQCEKIKNNWILATYFSEHIITYNLAQKYYIDKNNTMISQTIDNSGTWADIFLLVKKPEETCATMIGHIAYGATIIGQEKRFRKSASIYFEDKEELVKRINNKEFKSNEIQELAKAYSELF